MKIHIIQPTFYTDPASMRPFKTKKLNLVPLTLAYLAALVEKEVPGADITLTDERVQDLDLENAAKADCVFLTVWTINSLRAYEVADRIREKGVPVVMGGPHCYFHAEEAAERADSVAVGEGEGLVGPILEDLSRGELKDFYRAESLHDLRGLPQPRRDLLEGRCFTRFHTVAVQTSRGCPFTCEFCAERFYLGQTYRTRPVDEVVEEIRRTGKKRIFFADSTFTGNRSRTMELMERLIPMGLQWSALWTAHRVLDADFMELAKKSGLLHVNIGVESVKQETLDGMNKKTTNASRLAEVVKRLRALDISFSFNLIFGWDTDRPGDFASTLEFLEKNRVHVAFFNSFCPYKGTPVYEKYMAEERILDPENMNRWPGVKAKVHPRNLSPGELEGGIRALYRDFYSWPSILKRLGLPRSKASIASWTMNLSQRKMVYGGANNFDEF